MVAYATGLLAIAALLAVWVGTQAVWRRTFPADGGDEDALAGRMGCHGCGGTGCGERSTEERG